MIKTKITELFGIKHPIMLAGMNWITEYKLVSAVSNAGGLGILATGRFTPGEIRKQIKEIRELTDKPFGINQTLNHPRSKDNVKVAIEEKVPIINYSLGRPWFIEQVHEYGGKVIGTVAMARHAVRAEQLGCDVISVTGNEAAAHGADVTSLILVPIVSSMVKVPLLAAGGFYNGRGLAAALVLGADAISMGTRFVATKESDVHENYKQLILKAAEQDTLYSDRFDGMPGRVLKTKGAEAMMRRKGLPIMGGLAGVLHVKRMLGLSWRDIITAALEKKTTEYGARGSYNIFQQLRFAGGSIGQENAIYYGNTTLGFMFAGQGIGGIQDTPGVSELIERIVAEAEEILGITKEKIISQR
ncbi:NAD(P)H-dependent flavin oxidoreductase [Chloroflexota bacterium]